MSDRIIPKDSNYDVATCKLLSDGKDITNEYTLLSITVSQIVNRVPTARIVLRDGATADETFAASQGSDLIPGKQVEIAIGYDGRDRKIFQGLIIKHSLKVCANGDSMLTLDCKGMATKLTVGRHSRYFVNTTDSNAIAEIINQNNLSAETEATQVQHPEIVQYRATDWDFILSRAEMNGKIVLAEDNKIKVKAPTTSGSPLISLTYGANLLELEAAMDARSQYNAVTAKSWSYTDGVLISAEGQEPTISRQGNLSGKQLANVINLSTLELRHGGFVSQPELKAWADAQMLKSRLAKIQGRVKTKGYPDAKPDVLVELKGVGDRFNGLAYVSGVRHEMVGGAWFTHMQLGLVPEWFYQEAEILEKPAAGLVPGVNGLQIGVVVQLQGDPNGEDRILVKIPIIDSQADGTWARIATLDAGNNRGSFFRPEIGDEVIVGFLNDDPRDPVVLGMLNSSSKPAPLPTTDDNHRKGFFSRSQMQISFDDEKKIITLQTPGGNKIAISDEDKGINLTDQNGNTFVMSDRGMTVKSSKDISIEATGKLTLKANSDINIQGLNVSITANGQFKAQGTAGAEVSSSATAILKGSLVLIN
ncbi:type VI secretion system tip protein VgrG [Scytonema sp. UIC 10036]|uniref:type VI secretion system tip protein VgrG n=1 Tax=Scytonema sp. UIC 10036 TaxID=2304196 RepID=UPI0012DA5173|nr:type VI secretion system tip protein VgrG [Scytonema sp. UIC 10036]MUG97762.1 type VI secretion system tip protein VgrG [Scytonema sp. UIC 10036]